MMRLLQTWSRFRKPVQDYSPQATALFSHFAERHGLAYKAVDAPVEILWEFPEQVGLSLPITLGLQNNDELNFGVPGFWSYFFPFPKVATKFEQVIDAWVEGRARITRRGLTSRLQVPTNDGTWSTVYTAKGHLDWDHPGDFIQNRATPQRPPW
jgi:hypothetical protein